MTAKNESGQGVAFGLGATLLWGSYPLWYKPLAGLDAYHLLSWRVVFAELFLLALVLLTARVGTLRSTLKTVRPANVLTVSAVLGLWWLMYIYGIMTGRVLEVAFGYFLSPIMSMLVSRVIFKERLTSLQTWAIFLAVTGVTLMAFELLNLRSFRGSHWSLASAIPSTASSRRKYLAIRWSSKPSKSPCCCRLRRCSCCWRRPRAWGTSSCNRAPATCCWSRRA